MPLIIGLIADTGSPQRIVVHALQDLQPNLTPEQVQVTPVAAPPGVEGPLWRWTLVNDAPPVLDAEVTVHPGAVEQGGHWRPTGPTTPAQIKSGLVVTTHHGLVVVGVHQGEDDPASMRLQEADQKTTVLDLLIPFMPVKRTEGTNKPGRMVMADMGTCDGCGKRANRTFKCSKCGKKYCNTCKNTMRKCSCGAVSGLVKPN